MVNLSINEKIERFKLLSDDLLKENKKVYIKDIDNNLYFADIIFVGERSIEISCFAPTNRDGQKYILYWSAIDKLQEYRIEPE